MKPYMLAQSMPPGSLSEIIEYMAHPSDFLGLVTVGWQADRLGGRFYINGIPLSFYDVGETASLGTLLYKSITMAMSESVRGSFGQEVSGHKIWKGVVSAEQMWRGHEELVARGRAKGLFPIDQANRGDVLFGVEGDSWSKSTIDVNGLLWPTALRASYNPRIIGANYAYPNAIMGSPTNKRINSAYRRLPRFLETIRYAKRSGRKFIGLNLMYTNDSPSITNGVITEAAYFDAGLKWLLACQDAGADVMIFPTYPANGDATNGRPAMSQMVRDNATKYGYLVADVAAGPLGTYVAGANWNDINHPSAAGLKVGIYDVIRPVFDAALTGLRA